MVSYVIAPARPSAPFGLFYQAGRLNEAEEHLERRYHMTDAWTRYTLDLAFDAEERLVSAQYKGEWFSDYMWCVVKYSCSGPAKTPGPCDVNRNSNL